MLIIDTASGLVIAQATDPNVWLEAQHRLIEEPEGFTPEHSGDWYWNGEVLIHDAPGALNARKTARVAQIKREAAERIAALDWKVQRAQEREKAGWGVLSETAAVLAEREAIRQSSDAAEARLRVLTTPIEVEAFTWTVDVSVPTPRLLTQKQFADRFTDAELTALVSAARQNPAIAAWLERFRAAQDLNLDAPMAQNGIWALEMAGLLAPGRATEILS